MERLEVVDPSHRQYMAPRFAGLAGRHESHAGGLTDRWVRGAVDEAGLVATFVIGEAGLLGRKDRDIRDRRHGSPRVVERHVGGASTDPHPDIVLRRRRAMAFRPDDLREGRE